MRITAHLWIAGLASKYSYFKEEISMLWTVFVILLILWLLGFSFQIGGGIIHILLVAAVVVLIYNLITGRRGL